ncbi:MAG: STAS domain-containing protein [Ruminococcaceae bacterium]|nr:STAS domain-containing protein [Oscillospiraceae bacterium]
MHTQTSALTLHQREDGLICVISGDIDHHSARTVRTQIDEALLSRRPARLILDLSQVSFMDSSGLGLILGRFNKAAEIGTEFLLLNPNAAVTRILDIAGIGRLIKIERKKYHERTQTSDQ